MMMFYSLRPIFIFSDCLLFFQLDEPVAVTDSYFIRMFSRLFFTFSGD